MKNNGKRSAARHRTKRPIQTVRAKIARRIGNASRTAKALAATIAVALGMTIAPAAACGATSAKIEEVPEAEFEPIGYEASFDFDDVKIISGFESVDDVGVYFDHRLSNGDNPALDDLYVQVKDHPGLAFPIDESTEKGSAALRYTGGAYKGEAFDAIVTLTDWTYLEPDCGWENYAPYYEGHEVFQPGVYLSTHWKSLSDGPEGFQNFNFYTVGLSNLTVSVQFVRAGTDDPIEVKGHATCIDLDTTQAFEFGGAITGGRIVEDNDVLYLENDGTRVASEMVHLSTDGWNHPDEYRKGLVETFYDTAGSNFGKSAEFHFFPGWRESELEAGSNPDPQSFFALTPDFLTAPNPEENPDGQTEVVKTADKTEGVAPGDEVEYTVDFKAHEQGVNCRVGYRYSALEIVDTLPAEMSYMDGSARLVDENGEPIENAGAITVEHMTGNEDANEKDPGTDEPDMEGAENKPVGDIVRFAFDKEFLANMPMKGEHYRLVFKAKLDRYPADGSLSVVNSSYAMINSTGKTPSNDVETKLAKPALSIVKTSDKRLYEAGETALYTLTVTQNEEGATAENVVVKDLVNSADAGSIVEGSLKAAKGDDEPATIEPAYLRDDERIIGFEFASDADLAYGETITLTYKAIMEKPGATVANTATTWSDNAGEAEAENEVEIAAIPAKPENPIVAFEKSADKDRARIGDKVAYLIRASVEDADIANVVISDDSLPEGMPIDRESIAARVNGRIVADLEPVLEGNGFSVRFETLHAGDVVEIAYIAQAEDESIAGTSVTNTAILTSESLDDPLKDEATVDIVNATDSEEPPAASPSPDDSAPSVAKPTAPTGKFVKTGDGSAALLLPILALAGVSCIALAATVSRRRRTSEKQASALARATGREPNNGNGKA